MRIILATNNSHKVDEYRQIIGEKYKNDIYTMSMLDIQVEPEENGKTLEENAIIKVEALYNSMVEKGIYKEVDLLISDDTGLFIDFLDGAPGIYSARFLGENATAEEKNIEVIKRLNGVEKEKRTACFKCAIASIYKGEKNVDVGMLDGYIAEEIKDFGGFGYDPIFIDKKSGKTYSAMGMDEKNKISHRYKAWEEIKKRYKEKFL